MARLEVPYLEWSEAQFQSWLEKFATTAGRGGLEKGWLYFHPFDSRRSRKGFPDTTLVHPGWRITIFAELKREDPSSKPTDEQQRWLEGLAAAGQYAYLWRPRHKPLIMDILSGVEAPRAPRALPHQTRRR